MYVYTYLYMLYGCLLSFPLKAALPSLLRQIWIRYVELLNVLVMLFNVANDQHAEAERGLQQELETMNLNYVQAVRALEKTITDNVTKTEDFEEKYVALTRHLRTVCACPLHRLPCCGGTDLYSWSIPGAPGHGVPLVPPECRF